SATNAAVGRRAESRHHGLLVAKTSSFDSGTSILATEPPVGRATPTLTPRSSRSSTGIASSMAPFTPPRRPSTGRRCCAPIACATTGPEYPSPATTDPRPQRAPSLRRGGSCRLHACAREVVFDGETWCPRIEIAGIELLTADAKDLDDVAPLLLRNPA